MDDRLGIDELAEAAGLTRRAVRFYVQQKLLPAPLGVGRGKHYDRSHLDRLKRLQELQSAGYSLDDIRRILDGAIQPGAMVSAPRPVQSPERLELWTRMKVADGLELHLDRNRFDLTIEQLLAAKEVLRSAFGLRGAKTPEQQFKPERKSRGRNGSR